MAETYAGGTRPPSRSGRRQLDELDQVPAGVVEHSADHRPHLGRRLGEGHGGSDESIVLLADVVDDERCERDAIGRECLTVGRDGRVPGWLEEQLDFLAGRCDGGLPYGPVTYELTGRRGAAAHAPGGPTGWTPAPVVEPTGRQRRAVSA